MMAAAARIKAVERDDVFFVSLEWSAIGQSHRHDSTVVTAALRRHFEAKQVALLVAGEYFLHHSFYFLGRKLRCHDVVFVRSYVPEMLQRFGTSDQTRLVIERAVHHAVNWQISFRQRVPNRLAYQSLHIAWHPGTASATKRLGQFTNWRRKRGARFCELRFCSRNNHAIKIQTIIHQLADRFPMKQLFGIPVEQKIDSPDMNAEMIGLSEEHAIRQTAWNCLMRVTSDKDCRLRKFRGQSHYGIGKIITAGAHFQSH